MVYILIITMVITIIALIMTIQIGNQGKKEEYNVNKSFTSLSIMYMILIPVIIIFGIVGWYMFL